MVWASYLADIFSFLIRIFDQIVHLTISAHIAHALKLHAEMHVFVALRLGISLKDDWNVQPVSLREGHVKNFPHVSLSLVLFADADHADEYKIFLLFLHSILKRSASLGQSFSHADHLFKAHVVKQSFEDSHARLEIHFLSRQGVGDIPLAAFASRVEHLPFKCHTDVDCYVICHCLFAAVEHALPVSCP